MSLSISAGTVVGGRYRIDREIGRGGMATVYLALDEVHARQVAVKVLAPDLTRALDADRFVAEIRTTAGLSHPHILALLDSGKEKGRPFYVTPYIRGESLRGRLEREGTLPLDEALRIGSAIAGALAYAHMQGVIHCDVKPANILLDRMGNPYLADFGVARALAMTGDASGGSVNRALGTLRYMSPEQIAGERDIDGGADLYALGCVVFEMLAGSPPFGGSTPQSLLAAHLVRPPPSLRKVRADVPLPVDEIVQAMLSKSRADRITEAGELKRRLDELGRRRRLGGRSAFPLPRGRGRVALAVGAAMLVAAAALAVSVGTVGSGRGGEPLDTARYAVLPIGVGAVPGLAVPVEELFEDALRAWDSLTVVERVRLTELAAREEMGSLTLEQARSLAAAVGAGRLITVQARTFGDDSVRVEAALRPSDSPDDPLRIVTVVISRDVPEGKAAVARAVEELLFGRELIGSRVAPATRSAPARREYAAGAVALADWDLEEAERRFDAAARYDPAFTLAVLWKAQVMSWQGRITRDWADDARRAARGAAQLAPRERGLATALAAMADNRYPEACDAYEELRSRNPRDFAAWFGLGQCRSHDQLVVADASSPTGWSFRSSAHQAAHAYREAFLLDLSSHRAFGTGGAELVSGLLYARRAVVRRGRSGGADAQSFVGFADWHADSLRFVPVPTGATMGYSMDANAVSEALIHQRRGLLDVTDSWARAFPESAGALHAHAVARDLVGDASALRTYRRARELASDMQLRASIGTSEILLTVRLAFPNDVAALRSAVALADSLIAGARDGAAGGAGGLTELAALLGRPIFAASLARDAPVGSGIANTPPEVRREGEVLLAYAAIGAPVDSIRSSETRIERLIQRLVPREDRDASRQAVLEQAALLALPGHRSAFLNDPRLARRVEARAAAMLPDVSEETLAELSAQPVALLGWDVLLAAANVLVAAGRPGRALEMIAERLETLGLADPGEIGGMARAAAVVRVGALRAELEGRLGSPSEAVRWASGVLALWGAGEPAVEPVLRRMSTLIETHRASP